MQQFGKRFLVHQHQGPAVLSVILSWCIGLCLGCIVFLNTDPEYFSWMRRACFHPVSIVGLIGVAFFPLLIHSLSCFAFSHRLLAIHTGIRSFFFFLCSAMLLSAFPSGGWLVRLLLMFTGFGSAFFGMWLYIRVGSVAYRGAKERILYTACLAAIVCLDYFIISPYVTCLLNEF